MDRSGWRVGSWLLPYKSQLHRGVIRNSWGSWSRYLREKCFDCGPWVCMMFCDHGYIPHTLAPTSPLSPETSPIVRKPGFQTTTSPENEKKQSGTENKQFFMRACPRGPPLVRNQSDSPEPVRRISPAPVRKCLLTCLLLEKHFESILGPCHHHPGQSGGFRVVRKGILQTTTSPEADFSFRVGASRPTTFSIKYTSRCYAFCDRASVTWDVFVEAGVLGIAPCAYMVENAYVLPGACANPWIYLCPGKAVNRKGGRAPIPARGPLWRASSSGCMPCASRLASLLVWDLDWGLHLNSASNAWPILVCQSAFWHVFGEP